ncbi:MAG: hypothetical protein ACI8TX_003646 [Hyphomicrobiaceae bacterium]|jgi:hypothetical protein
MARSTISSTNPHTTRIATKYCGLPKPGSMVGVHGLHLLAQPNRSSSKGWLVPPGSRRSARREHGTPGAASHRYPNLFAQVSYRTGWDAPRNPLTRWNLRRSAARWYVPRPTPLTSLRVRRRPADEERSARRGPNKKTQPMPSNRYIGSPLHMPTKSRQFGVK